MKAKGSRGQGVAFWGEEEKRRQVPAFSSTRHRLNTEAQAAAGQDGTPSPPCRSPVRVTHSLFQDPDEKQR